MLRDKTIYAVDFDGTLAKTEYPRILEANEEVVEFVQKVQERGDEWILWTNREGETLDSALAWLFQRGLRPTAINDNVRRVKEFMGRNPRKVYADYYIDDHNVGGVSLPELD